MHRFAAIICFAGSLAVLPAVSAFAVTAKEKMATCKIGADSQGLKAKERAAFLKNCMANRNDPRGSAAPAAGGAPSGTAEPGPPEPQI